MTELEKIIKGCKRHNRASQRVLYEKFAPAMKGICLRYLGNTETAKDVLQEGFIKVFSNIGQYKGKGTFEGWMKRIFINTSISCLRKQNVDNKYFSVDQACGDEHLEEDTGIDDKIDGAKTFNYEELDEKDLIELAELSEAELFSALESVPDKYRTVFNLFCIEHHKHEEIAEMLDIEKITSRTRLSRARKLIQEQLLTFCRHKLTESAL